MSDDGRFLLTPLWIVSGGVVAALVVGALAYTVMETELQLGDQIEEVRTQRKDIDRASTRHSHAYVEGKQAALLILIDEYHDPNATAGQRQVIRDRIHIEAALLPEDALAEPIRRFLAETK